MHIHLLSDELLTEILSEIESDDLCPFNEQYTGSYCNSSSSTAMCTHAGDRFNEDLPIRQAADVQPGQKVMGAPTVTTNENAGSIVNQQSQLSQVRRPSNNC